LTTIVSSANFCCRTTSATRSVPEAQFAEVSIASNPNRHAHLATSILSVATHTDFAPLARAFSATCTTIGLPAMSRSGLFGNRVEPKRAGITTMKSDIRNAVKEARKTKRPASSDFFFRGDLARFVLEHHRDVILDRIREPARFADQLRVAFPVDKRAFAQRTDQDVEKLCVHSAFF
jgi:hypothetical protein